jgi:prepilin-type N-terminal cleavage/methylation domain-containing protein
MVSHKNKKGFTIVELLIVIVVIGILATLVIVTFTGIQQKARNTQRQTDIKAVQGYVESFYAEFGFYPNAADLNEPAFRSNYLKGLDPHALSDPKQAGDTGAISANAPSGYQYSYQTSTDTASVPCTATLEAAATNPTDNGCTKYILTSNLEGSGTPYVKTSN